MAGAPGLTDPAVREGGRPCPEVLDRLFARPGDFSFVQAVRILFHAYGAGRTILDFMRQDLRVRPHLSLGFPATDIVSLERLQGEGPRFRLTVSMLGLYGASSPLPAFYTEDLLREENEDRSGLRAFMDVVNDGFFSHYLHAGWFRYRVLYSVGEQKNASILEYFYAPGGLSDPALLGKGKGRYNLMPLVGGLSQYPRSAAGLESFLAGCLGLPVRVEQCVPRKAHVPLDQQCRLGGEHRLGESAILGCRAPDVNGKINVIIGPSCRSALAELAPRGRLHRVLHQLRAFYCTEPLFYDLHLVLAVQGRERNGPYPGSLVLGREAYGRLGWDSWLALPETWPGVAFFPERPATAQVEPGLPQDATAGKPAGRATDDLTVRQGRVV